jgi:cholera toxin transcriptional activator
MAADGKTLPTPSGVNVRRFGAYEVDLRTGELRKNGLRLKLQEQSFQVLAMLLEQPGELVTREQMREKLWPADTFVDFDHGLNTAVNKLRDVLNDSAASPRYIETLPRRGYRFVYPVEKPDVPPAAAVTSAPTDATPAATLEMPSRSRGLYRLLFLLLQGMYLAIYVAALGKFARAEEILVSWFGGLGNQAAILLLVTAVLGIAVRLFLLNAALFDSRNLGWLFLRLFWALFVLDVLWALSPFLLAHKIGVGLAFAAFATMVWLPFAQRTLVRMASQNKT